MAGLNKVTLIGNIGKDPETRYTPDGTAITNFSIATSDEWTDRNTGEKRERTEWHRIVAFRKLAEICGEYLAKGIQVFIEGKLQTRKWDKDGQTHYATEIVASQMLMLGGGNNRGQQNDGYRNSLQKTRGNNQGSQNSGMRRPGFDGYDDIPF